MIRTKQGGNGDLAMRHGIFVYRVRTGGTIRLFEHELRREWLHGRFHVKKNVEVCFLPPATQAQAT